MTAQEKITVLVVDDSAFMCKALRSMIERDPDICVVASAKNGLEGVELARKHQPDIVTLDLDMPQLDGLSALPRIKRACQAQVIVISGLTTDGSAATLAALRAGAADFITKESSLPATSLDEELRSKIHALASRSKNRSGPAILPAGPGRALQLSTHDFDLVVIGASTGGPPVLEYILGNLPAAFTQPIVIAQHLPVLFTRAMAERLHEIGPLAVRHAEHDIPVLKSHAYIGQGGQHVRVARGAGGAWKLLVSPKPEEALYKPSVNELFSSVAEVSGSRTLAILLTGMGDDGLTGAQKIHAAGGTILTQDPESCVVYGMPKAVFQTGIAAASMSPEQIVRQLRAFVEGSPVSDPKRHVHWQPGR